MVDTSGMSPEQYENYLSNLANQKPKDTTPPFGTPEYTEFYYNNPAGAGYVANNQNRVDVDRQTGQVIVTNQQTGQQQVSGQVTNLYPYFVPANIPAEQKQTIKQMVESKELPSYAQVTDVKKDTKTGDLQIAYTTPDTRSAIDKFNELKTKGDIPSNAVFAGETADGISYTVSKESRGTKYFPMTNIPVEKVQKGNILDRAINTANTMWQLGTPWNESIGEQFGDYFNIKDKPKMHNMLSELAVKVVPLVWIAEAKERSKTSNPMTPLEIGINSVIDLATAIPLLASARGSIKAFKGKSVSMNDYAKSLAKKEADNVNKLKDVISKTYDIKTSNSMVEVVKAENKYIDAIVKLDKAMDAPKTKKQTLSKLSSDADTARFDLESKAKEFTNNIMASDTKVRGFDSPEVKKRFYDLPSEISRNIRDNIKAFKEVSVPDAKRISELQLDLAKKAKYLDDMRAKYPTSPEKWADLSYDVAVAQTKLETAKSGSISKLHDQLVDLRNDITIGKSKVKDIDSKIKTAKGKELTKLNKQKKTEALNVLKLQTAEIDLEKTLYKSIRSFDVIYGAGGEIPRIGKQTPSITGGFWDKYGSGGGGSRVATETIVQDLTPVVSTRKLPRSAFKEKQIVEIPKIESIKVVPVGLVIPKVVSQVYRVIAYNPEFEINTVEDKADLKSIIKNAVEQYNKTNIDPVTQQVTVTDTETIPTVKLQNIIKEQLKTSTLTDTEIKELTEAIAKEIIKTDAKIKTQAKTQTELKLKTKLKVQEQKAIKEKIKGKFKLKFDIDGEQQEISLTKKEKDAIVAWKQGIVFVAKIPPYKQKDTIYSRKPLYGVKYHKGARSAFDSVTKTSGTLPVMISHDMGFVDIDITTKNDKPTLDYTREQGQYKDNTSKVLSIPGIDGSVKDILVTTEQYNSILAYKKNGKYTLSIKPYDRANTYVTTEPVAGIEYSKGTGDAYRKLSDQQGGLPIELARQSVVDNKTTSKKRIVAVRTSRRYKKVKPYSFTNKKMFDMLMIGR